MCVPLTDYVRHSPGACPTYYQRILGYCYDWLREICNPGWCIRSTVLIGLRVPPCNVPTHATVPHPPYESRRVPVVVKYPTIRNTPLILSTNRIFSTITEYAPIIHRHHDYYVGLGKGQRNCRQCKPYYNPSKDPDPNHHARELLVQGLCSSCTAGSVTG